MVVRPTDNSHDRTSKITASRENRVMPDARQWPVVKNPIPAVLGTGFLVVITFALFLSYSQLRDGVEDSASGESLTTTLRSWRYVPPPTRGGVNKFDAADQCENAVLDKLTSSGASSFALHGANKLEAEVPRGWEFLGSMEIQIESGPTEKWLYQCRIINGVTESLDVKQH